MAHPPVGIDLGTSTSVVSVFLDGKATPIPDPDTKSPIVPSVVGLSRTGELLVGQRAVDRSFGPELRETKRGTGRNIRYQLGESQYTSEEVAAIILRYLKRNAEVFLGSPIEHVVISVPANYEDVRRRAVMSAAQLAGLQVVRLINEPTAAAMAYGITRLDRNETILVYDFGGGTLDVSILEMIEGVMDVRTSHGAAELGGKDFDAAIIGWARGGFAEQYPQARPGTDSDKRLKRAAEAAKKDLTQDTTAALHIDNYAASDGEMVDLDLVLSRRRFEELVSPLIGASIEVVDAALVKAGMQRESVSRVLLVGGTTWVPAVRSAVLSHVGKPAASGCDPDLAVSLGACISAAIAAGTIDAGQGLVVQDVCTYGLGTLTVQDVAGRIMLAYDELMPPNTPVPYSVTRDTYSLLRPDQDAMDLELVQDLTGRSVLPEDTVPTGCEGQLTGIPPSLTDTPHRVALQFSYDANGIVQLRAWLPDLDDLELTLVHSMRGHRLHETAESAARVDDLWERSPLATRHMPYIRRAQRVLEERPANADAIGAAVTELKLKISMGDDSAAQDACEHLLDLLAEL